MPGENGHALPKRSREETRDLLLSAGAKVAAARIETPEKDMVGGLLAHIRLKDVLPIAAEMAGASAGIDDPAPITSGAAYQIWPTQAEYQADLVFHLLKEVVVDNSDIFAKEALRLIAEGVDGMKAVGMLTDLGFKTYRDDPLMFLLFAFTSLAGVPVIREALNGAFSSYEGLIRPAYEALIAAAGRRVRPPFTIDDIQVTLTALLDGYIIRGHISRSLTAPEGERANETDATQQESLFGAAARAIVEALTEPLSPVADDE